MRPALGYARPALSEHIEAHVLHEANAVSSPPFNAAPPPRNRLVDTLCHSRNQTLISFARMHTSEKNQALLTQQNTLLILNLAIDVVIEVADTQPEHQVHGRLFLDVAVGQSAAVLELPTSKKNWALLIR